MEKIKVRIEKFNKISDIPEIGEIFVDKGLSYEELSIQIQNSLSPDYWAFRISS